MGRSVPWICGQRKTLWERACSRRRWHSLNLYCLTHRYREQARSHSGQQRSLDMWSTQNPVGASLLAKASEQSAFVLPEIPLSRAGSLLQWMVEILKSQRRSATISNDCGSGLCGCCGSCRLASWKPAISSAFSQLDSVRKYQGIGCHWPLNPAKDSSRQPS